MTGFTDEEIFLNRLSASSFLRLWSWPNLFRDQGDSNKNGDGKEICDLTVVFGTDIIIFSDKKVDFSASIDQGVAWSRWSRRAIGHSVKQIKGARRWFKEYPNRVFVDKKCTHKIPIELPNKEAIRFHNIVVCHGIEETLSTFNSEASFIIDNSIHGAKHWSSEDNTPLSL